MSPEARAKIAAAARARWARAKSGKTAKPAPAKPAAKTAPAKAAPKSGKKTRVLTPEGRARLAAAMKARWAARKQASA